MLLEDLIFETDTIRMCFDHFDGNGNPIFEPIKIKYVVWSGEVLSKIDLSEVSFDDVVWSLDFYNYFDPVNDDYLEENFLERHNDYYKNVKIIDLSNTNAKIDFSKSASRKLHGVNHMGGCNFENVDLSHNQPVMVGLLSNCNFANTGLKIDISYMKDLDNLYSLGEMMSNGSLAGCYITDKKINGNTSEIRKQNAKKLRDEYEKMKENIISATTSDLDQQIRGFSKK